MSRLVLIQALLMIVMLMFGYWIMQLGGLGTEKQQLFNWHPLLMSIAFVFFTSQAILSYRFIPKDRITQKRAHLAFNAFALIIGIVGIVIVYHFHTAISAPHFYSVHSWLGLISIILIFMQWTFGFIAFYTRKFSMERKAQVLPIHVYVGFATYILLITAVLLGIFDKQRFLPTDNLFTPTHVMANMLAFMVVLVAVIVTASVHFTPRYAETKKNGDIYDDGEDGHLLVSDKDIYEAARASGDDDLDAY